MKTPLPLLLKQPKTVLSTPGNYHKMLQRHFMVLLILLSGLFFNATKAFSQTTTNESFEAGPQDATTFTSNSQAFNIVSNVGGPFVLDQLGGYGWNGSAPDNWVLDNYAGYAQNASFSITSGTRFRVNHFYIQSLDVNGGGEITSDNVTITGSLGGTQVFTETAFVAQGGVSTNNYALIDLTSFGGANNTGKTIDKITITGGANTYNLVIDDFNWTTATPTIIATGTLAALTSTYGAASASESFNLSGASMTGNVLVTAPAGFEVSTDNSTFTPTVTVGGAGDFGPTLVYIRLKATDPAGAYPGPVVLSSTGATNVNEAIASSTVNPAPLTITADNQTKAYAAAVPTLTASYSGFVNGDNSASLTTLPTLSTTATAASHVAGSPYSITASGAVDPNYTISYVPGSLTITTAPLTITADNQTKAYGDALPTLTASYSGFVNGDNSASLTTLPTLTTTATAASSVAGSPYAITASGAVDPDYTITYVAGNLTITQAALTITADNQTKAYGDALPTLTASYSGFVNGDNSASLTTLPTLSTTATAASSVAGSPYSITASGAVDPNYTISYVAGTLTITQAALTITADNQTKAYGDALPTLTASYSGFVNGDNSASLTTLPTLSTTATAASSVAGSPYAITASGAVDPNYTISYVAGTLTITQAALTITADNQTKAYGDALPTLTASYSGFVNGDTQASLTTLPTLTTTATAASSVAGSPYSITASGAVDPNYTISYVPGTLTVTAAALTISADNQTKAYGAALPTLTASYSGFVNGDNSASLTTLPTLSTTATAASSVAGSPYAITASGAVDPNYTISYVPGNLTITQAALTITADNQTKAYGDALPTLTASYSGFVNGDTQASLTTLPTLTTTATAASSVAGSPYSITASGAVDPNYTISYVPGTLTVTAAALTITADNQTKAYGAAVPTLTASYTGFVNGDNSASLTTLPTLSTTATAASSVAGSPYTITASGAVDPNYTISYVAGTLTITQAALTITADNQTKAYGAALPTLTASYSGFVNGDNSASLTTQPTLSTTATAASSVAGSPYPITASGAVDPNYTITYVAGTLTVTQATLTVTADNQNSTYGSAIPALTVSYSGFVNGDTQASLTTPATATTTATASSVAGNYPITPSGAVDNNYTINYVNGTLTIGKVALTVTADNQTGTAGQPLPTLTVSYSGFVNGDTQASLTTPATATTTATTSSPAGTYPITPSGAVDNNYTISYVNGTLTLISAVSSDATLANLVISSGTLTPAFATGTTSYTAAVTNTTTSITVTPTIHESHATVTVNGNTVASGSASSAISLNVGSNTITTVVTAQDGTTTDIYTIVVTRAASSDASLVNLQVNPGTLSPAFDPAGTAYTAGEIPNSTGSILVTATAAPGATIEINGIAATSGSATSVPLNDGNNIINVIVTAQDGTTTTTYNIGVYRGEPIASIDATNILTPNGDGKNDVWVVKDILLYPNNLVTVYDKAGRVVFTKHGYTNDWDGTYNGAPLAQGTYYFTVDLGPELRRFRGYISLIRN